MAETEIQDHAAKQSRRAPRPGVRRIRNVKNKRSEQQQTQSRAFRKKLSQNQQEREQENIRETDHCAPRFA